MHLTDYSTRAKIHLFRSLGITFLLNTVIALLLFFILQDASFQTYFIFSQCIGLTICLLVRIRQAVFGPPDTWIKGLSVMATILAGGLAGGWVGGWLSGVSFHDFTSQHYTLRIMLLSLLFGGIIFFYFFSREQILETREKLQEERIRRLTSEKEAVQAELKMLQAQIEPHFLFNTLANIQSLLDFDPEKGKQMLANLSRYLRGSLNETRSQWTTLGKEIDLTRAYLDLFQIRMEDRLQVQIEMEEHLRTFPFSPMLLQPLVENAVLHGLEGSLTGGAIHIQVKQENEVLRVTVADTGKGFDADGKTGLGLTNIRARLASIYDGRARLIISENQPSGVQATIEVPYDSNC